MLVQCERVPVICWNVGRVLVFASGEAFVPLVLCAHHAKEFLADNSDDMIVLVPA